ncbi:retrovirus-related pol polyprotein from transposon TNT 1-94 [Tanacetum coccineum]
MDSDKYLEGQSMQRPPLFESDSFIYWKNRFETYVKSKDLDLWHVITNGDFQPIQQNPETKLDEVIPFEKQSDDLKKRLAKNNEAKMVIYNALPRKEKFLRALHPKWRAKVTQIESSKELNVQLSLNELIGNHKVHEMIIKKDSEIVKAKVERKSFALKAKKESSDEECSTSRSEDEEYAMNGKSDRKCFRCSDPNHLIGECLKPPKDKNQRAFVGGSWRDSGEEDDEKVKNETCLVAQASSEVCSESFYFSDENSSIDDLVLDNEYEKLCKMSLKIITKNKRLKATRNSLEKELSILKEKVSTHKKNKGVDLECVKCHMLKIENEKLKEEALKLTKFKKSTHCLNEMLSNKKPSGDKLGLGFNSFEASSSGTKEIKFVKAQKKESSDGGPINISGPLSMSAAPKAIMGPPPVVTHGSEKRQICDNKCRVTFYEQDSEITKDGKVIGRKPTLDYFKVFGRKCFILNTKDYLTKFDPKSYEGIFLGYSQNSKAYIILNKHTRKVEESLNVTFDETPPPSKTSPLVDDDLDEEEAIKVTEKKNLENNIEDETLEIDEIVNIKESRNHPLENVIGNLNQRTLRSQAQNQSNFFCFISTIEPKNVNEALADESWIVAMQEELNQFIANDVWELVPQPRNMTIIGTKWVFRNKLDENGSVSQNKARLVAQGYNQQEGIDYNETHTPTARLEKQPALAISTTEAEYVSAGKACQQALWMKQALIDYDVRLDNVLSMCDNKGEIDHSKNPVQHSRTKHIEIRHHFLRDNVQKGHISIEKVSSLDNIADILMKPLKRESFNYLRLGLGMRKTRKDRGTTRGHHTTSSSSTFDQPSSSHLNDDDDDGNGKETSRASTPSPIRYVNSLTNQVPKVFQNPPNIDPHLEPFYTRQTEIINRQVQIQDEHRGGLRSIRKGLRNLWRNMKKKLKITIIPPKQLFVDLTNDDDNLTTPSPTTTSSSPTPPNAQSKTPSTNQTSSSQENTSSSFQSKLQISPPSSNEPTSPQPLNPLLDNISDVPPRPLNPQPLQSHPSLDITLSLSPITPLDHIHDTLSLPSPPQPQPPIMDHPLYYNYHDYHGSTCILIFNLFNKIQKPKLDEVIPFEKQSDDLKERLAKNNNAKIVIYNALPRKDQVKDNKIDLLVQQYEQFVISEDESIDSAFARFNTIITSLKALDEGYSSKNYVRKFLRALHPKWRAKVTTIEESKDLTSLSLDELIENLKVHEMIIKKDYEIVKPKVERKSLALKAKKESSDEECSTSGSEDEEYAMAVRDFKKFSKRRRRFVR